MRAKNRYNHFQEIIAPLKEDHLLRSCFGVIVDQIRSYYECFLEYRSALRGCSTKMRFLYIRDKQTQHP